MDYVQISIDIATSVSVIVAALSFLKTQISQSKANRVLAIRQQRIEQMSRLIADFSIILESGDRIVEKIRMAKAGREVNYSPDDFTGFCISVDRYIRINSKLLFEVWATENEKKALGSIKELVHSWNKKFVEAAINEDISKTPDFVKLIEDLGEKVLNLSMLLRNEVENVSV